MNEKLTLADGTELVGHGIETEVRLFLYIYEQTMKGVFDLMIDPEKIKVIKFDRYGEKGKYSGYRRLVSVSEERGGMICACLRK